MKTVKRLLSIALLISSFIMAPMVLWADGVDEPPHGIPGGGGDVPFPGSGGGCIQVMVVDVEGNVTGEWMSIEGLSELFDGLWIYIGGILWAIR